MSSLPYRFPEAQTPVHDYFYSMVELSVVRVFVEQCIFDAIPDTGISISELAEKTHVEYKLLSRFTRFLIAAKLLDMPAPDWVTLTPNSKAFQDPKAKLFYAHIFDSFMGASVKWTEYLSLNGIREPQESNKCPFGLAAGHPEKSFYEILELIPDRKSSFNTTMGLALGDMPIVGQYNFTWVAEYAKQPDASYRPLIVDVGGGYGQALKAIIAENPEIPMGSCVLQDQPDVIQHVLEDDGPLRDAKKIACSFFNEQQTKGALVYYIRRVLNDWSDKECIQILGKIRAACIADSRVLVSENLLPDEPSISLAAADIWMMNFGGKRRDARMFEGLAEQSGFKISGLSKGHVSNSAVIEMIPV